MGRWVAPGEQAFVLLDEVLHPELSVAPASCAQGLQRRQEADGRSGSL